MCSCSINSTYSLLDFFPHLQHSQKGTGQHCLGFSAYKKGSSEPSNGEMTNVLCRQIFGSPLKYSCKDRMIILEYSQEYGVSTHCLVTHRLPTVSAESPHCRKMSNVCKKEYLSVISRSICLSNIYSSI